MRVSIVQQQVPTDVLVALWLCRYYRHQSVTPGCDRHADRLVAASSDDYVIACMLRRLYMVVGDCTRLG